MIAEVDAWGDAAAAAALLAIDRALGGAVVRSRPGPTRDAWLEALRTALPEVTPFRRVPVNIDDDQMFGGVDLAASLAAGRRVAGAGLIDTCAGGVMVMAMAERCARGLAARVGARVDAGELTVVALDEGLEPDEHAPASLGERLAFSIDLDGVWANAKRISHSAIAQARARLAYLAPPSSREVEMVCKACAEFDIRSARAPMFALRAALASAALAGRERPAEEDWALAARLVLSPRARGAPPEAEDAAPHDEGREGAESDPVEAQHGDRMVDAVRSALPKGFLDQAFAQQRQSAEARQCGAGATAKRARRGRPAGARPGTLRSGERLDIVATLRAAAPWQALRRRDYPNSKSAVLVRRTDFHVRRHVQRLETTIVFAIDASGSTALQRLGEAKGAAEILLADAYVTRARVALIAFRDRTAQLLLPPTRSLARAKRALADLPGGGATPLASAIDAASVLAQSERAKGRTPLVVLLSDGRGNVDRAGEARRDSAEHDTRAAARALAGSGLASVFIDTSPRSRPESVALATAMGARYALLPYLNASAVADVVRAHAPSRR